jgi:hypothetical protein
MKSVCVCVLNSTGPEIEEVLALPGTGAEGRGTDYSRYGVQYVVV